MVEKEVEMKITKSPEFKIVYANGVFGGLSPMEGRMTFFVDRLMPEIVEGVPGRLKTGSIERELQVEIKMSPQQFLSISRWMQDHIDRMTKEGILKIKEEEPKKEGT